MAGGRRAPYTSYLECHYKSHVIYIRYKVYFRKDDVSKEVFEVLKDEKTIGEAIEKGFEVKRITDISRMPQEAIDEGEKREGSAQAKSHTLGRAYSL